MTSVFYLKIYQYFSIKFHYFFDVECLKCESELFNEMQLAHQSVKILFKLSSFMHFFRNYSVHIRHITLYIGIIYSYPSYESTLFFVYINIYISIVFCEKNAHIFLTCCIHFTFFFSLNFFIAFLLCFAAIFYLCFIKNKPKNIPATYIPIYCPTFS